MKTKDKNNSEYDYGMSVKETMGGLLVIVLGLIAFWGIQLLSSKDVVYGTTFPLSYIGVAMLILSFGAILYFIKEKL